MPSDKIITATLMDATYRGAKTIVWIPGERYRLRAVVSTGGVVKIKIDDRPSIEKRYYTKAQFNNEWDAVARIGVKEW